MKIFLLSIFYSFSLLNLDSDTYRTNHALYVSVLEIEKEQVLVAEESPEGDCPCACRTSSDKSEGPAPEANSAAVFAAVYYDING